MSRRLALGIALTAGGVLLSGCANINTELSTLKPVAGDKVTGLNIAVNDVLSAHDVPILVAPVCTFGTDAYSCSGTTVSGQRIEATASGAEAETMTVTVGKRELYSGPIAAVLTKAGRR